MKVEVLKENLKKAINICERITKKTISLPVLTNVLLKAEGNFLELITTNLETTIRWWVLAKIEKPGTLLVGATFLSNLVDLITEQKIELKENNRNLIITTKNQDTQVQGQNPEEFPIIPKIERETPFQIPIRQLDDGLSQIVDIPSPSQIRPEISGIFFSFKKDKLRLVSTDSFRLGEKVIDLGREVEKDTSFILPQEASRELMNVISQRAGTITCFSDANQAVFEFPMEETSHPQINVISRLIDGEYPNYQEIIPKKFTTKIQIDRELLQNQIKEAGLFSGKVSEVKITPLLKEKKIKIFSQSPEIGKNESYVPAKIEGEQFEISFNYRFLIDGLNNIKSSEIILELSGEEGPGVLRPVGDSSYSYVLMPIKAS